MEGWAAMAAGSSRAAMHGARLLLRAQLQRPQLVEVYSLPTMAAANFRGRPTQSAAVRDDAAGLLASGPAGQLESCPAGKDGFDWVSQVCSHYPMFGPVHGNSRWEPMARTLKIVSSFPPPS